MTLNKITNGSKPDALENMGNFDYILKYLAIDLLNGTTTINDKNAFIDTNLVAADMDSTEWTYDELANGFYGDILVDQTDDSSVDTDIWSNSGGTVTEDTSKIKIAVGSASSGTLSADQIDAPDFKTFSDDSKVLLITRRTKLNAVSNTVNWTIKIGSTTIFNQSHSTAATVSVDETRVLFIDKVAETASLYTKDGATLASDIDISSEGNWTVEFFVSSGTGITSEYWVYSLSYTTEGDSTTPEIVTANDALNVSATATFIYLTTTDDSLLTIEVSADGGGNYSAVSANFVTTNISNTGTNMRIKLNAAQPVTLTDDSSYEPVYWTEYALLYD